MNSPHREEGISEAVGFILILAAIIIALSLYLIYIVPAMGREGEIATMNEVKERLTEYKTDIDTLWMSRQCSTAYGPAISIGAGNSGGILSFIPIMLKPQNAYPVLALNQRDEYITITSDSYYPADSGGANLTGPLSTAPMNINVNRPLQRLFITISPDDLTVRKGVYLKGPTWSTWVNITPSYNNVSNFSMSLYANGSVIPSSIQYSYVDLLVGTDITISTYKGQSPVATDLAVYRNVSVLGVYPVDLTNTAYGISTELQNPQTVQAWTSNSTVNASYWVSYGTVAKVSTDTSPMGSLEFRSNNYYYIPQTYYYQLGGVFLEQQDGAIMEVPPSIGISYVNGSPVVRVGEILLWGNVQNNTVASAPITLATAVTDIKDTPLARGANTRWVNLSIQAANPNAAQMWNRTLREIADRGGLPTPTYTTGAGGNTAFLLISGNPQLYDIQLSVTRVNVSGDYLEENPPAGITRSWRSLLSYRGPPPPVTWTIPTQVNVPPPVPPQAPGNPLWQCGWGYRRNITINHTAVSGTLSNFPVLINITNDAGLGQHAQSNGWDINFTDSTGTKPLPYEREYFNQGAGKADLIAWVQVPSINNVTNTTIYMYYGAPASTDQQDRTHVWDSNFVGVWHLDDPSGGYLFAINDSTSYMSNGTDQGNPNFGRTGKIGTAINFDGTNDVISINNSNVAGKPLDFISGPFTISAWFKAGAGNRHIAGKRDGNSYQYQFGIGSGGSPHLFFGNSTGSDGYGNTVVDVTGSVWYYGAVAVDASGYPTLYMNGAPDGWTDEYPSIPPPYRFTHQNANFSIGARWNGYPTTMANFSGLIDEVRVSKIARSADWIATEYSNQNKPQLFAYLINPEDSSSACPQLVQSKADNFRDATSATLSLDQALSPGNLTVVSFVLDPQSLAVSNVTDSTGKTYTLARGPDPISYWGNLYTYYAMDHPGANTITVQFSGTAYFGDLFAAEFSGVASTNPLDQTSAGTGTTATIDSGSRNTTQDRELIYGFAATDSSASPNAPYIQIPPLQGLDGQFTAYTVVPGRGFYNVTGTNDAYNWTCQMVTFKAA